MIPGIQTALAVPAEMGRSNGGWKDLEKEVEFNKAFKVLAGF